MRADQSGYASPCLFSGRTAILGGFVVLLLLIVIFAVAYRYGFGGVSTPRAAVDSSMLPREFVVLDLETTGLDPTRNEIIEVGAIRVNLDSDSHVTFQTLVKPERRVPYVLSFESESVRNRQKRHHWMICLAKSPTN
jgi:hypothetical protein